MGPVPVGYGAWLTSVKRRVREAQLKAHRTVNTQLIELYWDIGRDIVDQQTTRGWGSGGGPATFRRLRGEFPEMTGLSFTNLNYMRSLALAWPEPIFQQAVRRLPWGRITVLLDKLDDRQTRDWYGPPPADSELAQQVATNPYVFDFLQLTSTVAERRLEQGLTDQMVRTLHEVSTGFAFVGRQVHLDVDCDDFYLDLLFFHVEQLRYIVLELKAGKFIPEHAGSCSSTWPSSTTASSVNRMPHRRDPDLR